MRALNEVFGEVEIGLLERWRGNRSCLVVVEGPNRERTISPDYTTPLDDAAAELIAAVRASDRLYAAAAEDA